ncbi:MAG: GntR family transcriptional regulator [Rhodospirillales bacterium]|nr:GntR family transcriptional regulator [Rhodospirillales bacterium]
MPPTTAPTLNGNLSRRGRRSIERRSLHRDVADQIRDMIVEGELPPGERVNEGALSEQFGISRTPLREALKVLASEGLVELRPNRGTRVSAITPEEVGELFEAVSGIERMAGELAALRMTERDIERLKALHERMERHYEAGERHEYFRLNQQIHNTIVSLAGNSILEATHASLMVRVRRARYMAIQSPERWHESVQEHRAIMQALEARDSAAAGDLILNHVLRTGVVVKQFFVASGPARTDH